MLLVKICMKVEIRALCMACGGVLESSSTCAEEKYHICFHYTIVLILLSLFLAFCSFQATKARVSFLVFHIWKLGICQGAWKPLSGLMHAEKHILFLFLFITCLL